MFNYILLFFSDVSVTIVTIIMVSYKRIQFIYICVLVNNNVCLNIFIGLLHKYKPFYCFLTLGSWPGIVTRTMKLCSFLFLPPTPYGLTALVGRSPIIVEVLRLLRHATLCRTPPLDERSASLRDLYLQIHSTHKRDIHASIGIRTRYPSMRETADLRLSPHGQWDRPCLFTVENKFHHEFL